MNNTASLIGLVVALAMAGFSVFMYLKTSDWVALVFLLGSFGYVIVFVSTRDKDSS